MQPCRAVRTPRLPLSGGVPSLAELWRRRGGTAWRAQVRGMRPGERKVLQKMLGTKTHPAGTFQ
eukprot:4870821-Prymnesium_polylepis.1